ncbi:MAG: nitroreductase [Bacteroidales bacterium]|nr:nitroreductase [Bacteroidales bacterium]MCR5277075.1 nitroreductase [Bacteroidales bacterium]
MENIVLDALKRRRSIRRYKPEQITDEELRAVLEAGTWAPTGMGYQDPWIVAVQNPALLDRISRMNRAILGSDSDPFYGAPTYVLVFASDPAQWANSVCDGSLVLGNMMIAAHAIGLGSCWINREREMFSTPEGKELMRELGLPDGLIGIGALALGYPASFPPTVKPRKENYYRIIK